MKSSVKQDAARLIARDHKVASSRTRKSKEKIARGRKRPGQLSKANGYRP